MNLKLFLKYFLIVIFIVCAMQTAHAQKLEISSTFNPVGSGARALGMGGAFIAVADDATAASWNPGGLIQLKRPEMSMVGAMYHRVEDNTFGHNPEACGSQSQDEIDLNYFSAAYPFQVLDRNMIFSLTYQHLYDFNREWRFELADRGGDLTYLDRWDFKQSGMLTALGASWCIEVVPSFSFGMTLNIWDDDLTPNKWEQIYNIQRTAELDGRPYTVDYYETQSYSFEGVNANFGFLWEIVRDKLVVGGVLKTPFEADIERHLYLKKIERYQTFPDADNEFIRDETSGETLDMPMSYGVGLVYKFSKLFYMSADIYKTHWGDFVYHTRYGDDISPVTGLKETQSDVGSTYQIRMGAEYSMIDLQANHVAPFRCGIFYDPAPSEGGSDEYYGFSIGSGYTKIGRFSFDAAYQYRYGDDVGASLFRGRDFSQDVEEHKIYASFIVYWSKPFKKKIFGL